MQQIQVSSFEQQRVQSYTLGGRQKLLVCDGALEHEVWDRVSASTPADTHDQFIQTLHDPRLLGQGPVALGEAWKPVDASGRSFVLGSAEGTRQEVHFGMGGRSGGEFTVKTLVPGQIEHQMQGSSRFGELDVDSIREQISVLA